MKMFNLVVAKNKSRLIIEYHFKFYSQVTDSPGLRLQKYLTTLKICWQIINIAFETSATTQGKQSQAISAHSIQDTASFQSHWQTIWVGGALKNTSTPYPDLYSNQVKPFSENSFIFFTHTHTHTHFIIIEMHT